MNTSRRAFVGAAFGVTAGSLLGTNHAHGGFRRRVLTPCTQATQATSQDIPIPVQLPNGYLAFYESKPFKIGRAGWRETRAHKGLLQYRDCSEDVNAVISHPRLDDIIHQIENCLTQAEVTAAAAAIVTAVSGAGGAAGGVAITTFKVALIACLLSAGINDANQITVTLSTSNQTCSSWHTVA